jgi:hypothetical protein
MLRIFLILLLFISYSPISFIALVQLAVKSTINKAYNNKTLIMFLNLTIH